MFDATEISLDNWEGIKKCRFKLGKGLLSNGFIHCCKINFPEGFFVNTDIGRRLTGKCGDYLVFGTNGNKGIEKRRKFEKIFEIIEENKNA
jgi:hypothetical protein